MNDYKKNLLKIPTLTRELSSTTAKLKDFEKMLSKTMQLWHDDSFKQIKNDEDKRFLENMMTSRAATYATADKVTQTKEAKKRRRGSSSVQVRILLLTTVPFGLHCFVCSTKNIAEFASL